MVAPRVRGSLPGTDGPARTTPLVAARGVEIRGIDVRSATLVPVSDLWPVARQRASEFDAIAVAYDRFRPRYPVELFDDLVRLGDLTDGARIVEVGAGTGIATRALVDRGLDVLALEPASGMAAVARATLGARARVEVVRFEDWVPSRKVRAVAAFNAWHWVHPEVGVENAFRALAPGGSLAIVWIEVVSWGEERFETRLAEVFGGPWPKTVESVVDSARPVEDDGRFAAFRLRRYRFQRVLDAASFVAVTRTYGGTHALDQEDAIRRIIDEEMGGSVTKVEDAVLNLTTPR